MHILKLLLLTFCIGYVGGMLTTGLRILFFLPYRNDFMCWYMVWFSPYYKRSKAVYDEIISLQNYFKNHSVSTTQGYQKFFEYLQGDIRFSSSYELHPISVEDIVSGKPLFREVEGFVCFYGTGKNYHKVIVFFGFDNGINLQSIQFIYHEEDRISPFFLTIQAKEFPPDDDDDLEQHRYPVSPPKNAYA